MIQKNYPAQLIEVVNTSELWNEMNPILFKGEVGIETDTHYFKIGDGISPWQALPYSRSSINLLSPGSGITIED